MKTPLIAVVWLSVALEVSAHGRSEEMIRELKAPVPEWMALAEPIKVEPVEDGSMPESRSLRPRSGGATNSRNRVQIPERGIEFQVSYEIDYTGKNEDGYGVSLSPDGTKLVVNTGMTTRLYEIAANGEHREVPIRLPHVTYDEGEKGWILGWSWAGDGALVGRGVILDETGHDMIEGRLYAFHLKEQALARLDLSALDLSDTDEIEIASIGEDLKHLRIRLGDREFAVKADLKSPPRLLTGSDPAPASNIQAIEQPPALKKAPDTQPRPSTQSGEPPSPSRWSVVTMVVVAVLALLWMLLKKRRVRRRP